MKKIISSTLLSISLLIPTMTYAATLDYVDYTVQSGDNFWKISQKYKMPISIIKEYNKTTSDILTIGEHLKIPVQVHIVESGDTFWKISQLYQVSISDIKLYNNKTTDIINIGEKLLISNKNVSLTTSSASTINTVNVDTYYFVKSGDTLWKVAQLYQVSTTDIKTVNKLASDIIYVGQKLLIPMKLSISETDLLARLVRAESPNEPYEGKVAVAMVVLNRVHNSGFPNTVTSVINETYNNGTIYAFSPVQNGQIKESATTQDFNAVKDALTQQYTNNDDSLFFFNPTKTSDAWIRTRTITKVIGNHTFSK